MRQSFWRRGDPVVWRSRPQGQLGYVMPLTVVVDTANVAVLLERHYAYGRALARVHTGRHLFPSVAGIGITAIILFLALFVAYRRWMLTPIAIPVHVRID